TSIDSLQRARRIGLEQGLRHVYAGNVPGRIQDAEDSFCSSCHERLIERDGYCTKVRALEGGRCARCGEAFPGVHSAPRRGGAG
ncbi:MAG: AmmeMemoRadiSam system radical SAM enzyme, partial [Planctomycetota bacterium]